MREVKKEDTRHPAVADMFYPGDPEVLDRELDRMLSESEAGDLPGDIRALVSPHAGYMYSGSVAASGFRNLRPDTYEIVAVICPSHRDVFHGISVFNGRGYETPLGLVPVASDYASALIAQSEDIFSSWDGHQLEHALEVQLPFLQKTLNDFSVIPIVMGDQDYETCKLLARSLQTVLKDEPTLIVASSDLSHYHPYDIARKIDGTTIRLLEAFDETELMQGVVNGDCEACGAGPIVATMMAAKQSGANRVKVLDYKNSGDVTGDYSAVVGYLAAVLYQTN